MISLIFFSNWLILAKAIDQNHLKMSFSHKKYLLQKISSKVSGDLELYRQIAGNF